MPKPSIALFTLLLIAAPVAARGGPEPNYGREVKPVLTARCYACHGALKQAGGLRLDTAGSIRAGGDGGPAVEPGKADESLLIDAITGQGGLKKMPPEGEPLATAEIEAISAWINAGAPADPSEPPQADPNAHWAFQPPTRPTVPDASAGTNPIDAFLAIGRVQRGVTAVGPTDRGELLRRASVDLTGLLPTRDELRAFLDDTSADAYERAVDRLLASPRYGERWARHWMDVWRYSDWSGHNAEIREGRPHIWRWRDWIVESLNADKGYDRMVVEMLAGDELAPEDPATTRATGYLARNWHKYNRNIWLQNTVDHSARAFLGLTLACARCHDHKYDPVAQVDYYRFRAFFEPHETRDDRAIAGGDAVTVRAVDTKLGTPTYLFARGEEKQPDLARPLAPGLPKVLGGPIPIEPIPLPLFASYPGLAPAARAEALASAGAGVAKAEAALAAGRQKADAARADQAKAEADLAGTPQTRGKAGDATAGAIRAVGLLELELAAARAGLASTEARLAADALKYREPPDPKPAELLALAAGRADRLAVAARAEVDAARAEQAVPASPQKAAKARAAATEARSKVDVLSAEYAPFGTVYPARSTGRRLALARWIVDRKNPLAARVAVNHIWMRHFGRPLVGTVADFGLRGEAPTHPELLDWLAVELMERNWSQKAIHRLIVTSEAYRMKSSAPSGFESATIDPTNVSYWRMNPRRMEAEAIRDNVLHAAGALDPAMGGPELDPATGLRSARRSLYFRHAAEKQVLFLKLFDAANVEACYRRDESVVPQQALALANSPLALAKARELAGRITAESKGDDSTFVIAAFERVLGRAPTDRERASTVAFLAEQAAKLADPSRLVPFDDGPSCGVAPSADPRQRAREGLVRVLFNHNDFLTIR